MKKMIYQILEEANALGDDKARKNFLLSEMTPNLKLLFDYCLKGVFQKNIEIPHGKSWEGHSTLAPITLHTEVKKLYVFLESKKIPKKTIINILCGLRMSMAKEEFAIIHSIVTTNSLPYENLSNDFLKDIFRKKS